MAKIFFKMKSDKYELVDKETGEIKEFIQTIVVSEEHFLKLYADVYADAIYPITGNAIKFFASCMKYTQYHKEDGNYFLISNPYLQKELEAKKLKNNTTKYLKELLEHGFIYRIRRSTYVVNPQIAFCGDKHSKAKAILKIVREQPQCIQ